MRNAGGCSFLSCSLFISMYVFSHEIFCDFDNDFEDAETPWMWYAFKN